MSSEFVEWLEKTKEVTMNDLKAGHDVEDLIRNTVEEFGEFGAAVSIEDGHKPHKNVADLKESSEEEAIDLIICALSLFYVRGGTNEKLLSYGWKKLNKWDRNVSKKLAQRLANQEAQ